MAVILVQATTESGNSPIAEVSLLLFFFLGNVLVLENRQVGHTNSGSSFLVMQWTCRKMPIQQLRGVYV